MDSVWTRMAHVCTTLLRRLDLHRAGERRVMVAVLRHCDQSRRTVGRNEQRLGARTEHAVPSLKLCAVDGEVRLVDQLVRVGAVLREACDADRDGGANGIARGLDVEGALGYRAADPLGDLQCLLWGRLRQEDGEFLAAETCGHVVVPQLGPEDLCDSLQHCVACKVAVCVVDVSEQVEVGHDQ